MFLAGWVGESVIVFASTDSEITMKVHQHNVETHCPE